MTDRQNKSIGLVVALAAVGALAIVAGVGAALFPQTPRIRDIRPIVTDRPLDAPMLASASSTTGAQSPGVSGARTSASEVPASTTTLTAAAQSGTTAHPTAAAQPTATRSTSGGSGRTAASALSASAARTAAVAAPSSSVKRTHESDHEVAKPAVRDEEHSDGVTRTWPYNDESSPSGSEESHK